MSAVATVDWPRASPQMQSGHVRAGRDDLAGVLPDGTPHFVPVAEIWYVDSRICCHLCGSWFRSVVAHLPSHGWTRARYIEAFGLEHGASLECPETRRRREASFRPRLAREPALTAGQELARSGELTRRAAKAARGRAHAEQRRPKTLLALSKISPEARAAGSRRRRQLELSATALRVAMSLGFRGVDEWLLDRLAEGQSLAQTSREGGLHENWLQRHLATVAPEIGSRLERVRTNPADRRWLPAVRALGYDEVRDYLVSRHLEDSWTVCAIAGELGFSRASVESAMRRHCVERTAHASSRGAAQRREREVSEQLGYASLRAYVEQRRAGGVSWADLAGECAVPASWLRRRAAAWTQDECAPAP